MPRYKNLTDLSKYDSAKWIAVINLAVPEWIPVSELVLDFQQRVPEADSAKDQAVFKKQQKEHIANLTASLERGEPLSPVSCVLVDGSLCLVDGYHRVEAAKKAGVDEILALVVTGSREAAERLSYEYNHKSQQLPVSKAQKMEQIWRQVRKYYNPDTEKWGECGPAEICRTFGMNPKSKTTINNMRDKVKEFGKDAALNMSWKDAKDHMESYEVSEEQKVEKELQVAEEIFSRFGEPLRLASIAHALQQMALGEEVTVEQMLQEREHLLEGLNPIYASDF